MFDFEDTAEIIMRVLSMSAIICITWTANLARADRIIIGQGFP